MNIIFLFGAIAGLATLGSVGCVLWRAHVDRRRILTRLKEYAGR